MYVKHLKVNPNDLPDFWLTGVLELRNPPVSLGMKSWRNSRPGRLGIAPGDC
jgi:hypothetical protein